MRPKFRHLVIGALFAQLLLLGYIARVAWQVRTIAALSYVELVSH